MTNTTDEVAAADAVTAGGWLLERGTLDPADLLSLPRPVRDRGKSNKIESNLALFLRKLVVLNKRKWFGDAELRLDTLVVHGGSAESPDLYRPETMRFPRVADGDNLASGGLLVYMGKPAHFLAISVMLSRDTKDSDGLAALIHAQAQSADVRKSVAALGALIASTPELAVLQAGLGAAVALGEVAYRLVRAVSPTCLGLYRAAWLANKNHFGVGSHPASGVEEVKDFQLAYEIVRDDTNAT